MSQQPDPREEAFNAAQKKYCNSRCQCNILKIQNVTKAIQKKQMGRDQCIDLGIIAIDLGINGASTPFTVTGDSRLGVCSLCFSYLSYIFPDCFMIGGMMDPNFPIDPKLLRKKQVRLSRRTNTLQQSGQVQDRTQVQSQSLVKSCLANVSQIQSQSLVQSWLADMSQVQPLVPSPLRISVPISIATHTPTLKRIVPCSKENQAPAPKRAMMIFPFQGGVIASSLLNFSSGIISGASAGSG